MGRRITRALAELKHHESACRRISGLEESIIIIGHACSLFPHCFGGRRPEENPAANRNSPKPPVSRCFGGRRPAGKPAATPNSRTPPGGGGHAKILQGGVGGTPPIAVSKVSAIAQCSHACTARDRPMQSRLYRARLPNAVTLVPRAIAQCSHACTAPH